MDLRTSEDIALITGEMRRRWEVDHRDWFNIVGAVEAVARDGFEVVEADEMEGVEGLTFPDCDILQIRSDIYYAACDGDGRARFTMAHELGHFVMHRGMRLARSTSKAIASKTEDSEWQADEFAALLLAPQHIIRGRTAADISQRCGLPMDVAINRCNKAKHR